ncbi:MAG TPA: ABC transporter permease [Candidatus Sulfopaludibacter sp.]|jgi:predicted permease|nr:ABC transporter permease [Candidatus Sulfopaludibacter sp.]
MRRFLARCTALLWRGHAERELEREVAAHLALMEEDFARRGMTAPEARLAARRAYGGVDLAKELHRDARSFVWLEQAARDVRHAVRSLGRTPGFALLAILTLALGVGVNTTLFTAYNAVALRPLPVAYPDRVVRLERWFESRSAGTIQYYFSLPEYQYAREHGTVFSALMAGTASIGVAARMDGTAEPEKLLGQLVTANYFSGLGVAAELGRTFLPEEDGTPGGNPVMVISHALWQQRFEGSPGVLGRVIQMNGTGYAVIGVAAKNFGSAAVDDPITQFWAPVSMREQLAGKDMQVQILGRMKDAVPVSRAEAETSLLVRQFGRTFEAKDRTTAVTLQHTSLMGNTEDIRFKAVVAGVMMLVGLVLLVACANIANMMLARGAGRQREIGVRLALGAGRGRMVRHLLTESFLLSFAGGLAGLVLSTWSSRLLSVALSRMLTGTPAAAAGFTLDLSVDARVFGYAMALSLAAGLFFGLAPALQFTRPDLSLALKEEGSSFGRQLTKSRLRGLLVGGQVAISMLLLITAGLLLRGLLRSHDADPGFETRGLFLMTADFGGKPAEGRARVVNQLRTRPELKFVALGSFPMMGTWTPPIVVPRGAATQPLRGRTLASYADEGYLATVGIPLLRGRGFTPQEVRTNAAVAVVSESAARRFWQDGDALGKRFDLDLDFRGTMKSFEVVGVVKDVRFANLTRVDPAHVYLTPKPGDFPGIVVRAEGDPRRAAEAIRAGVATLDRNMPASLWLTSVEDGPMLRERTQAGLCAALSSILAGLALVLAGVGIYGVMSYLVSRRVKEIGVRMALGASAGGVLRSVVLQSLRPVILGMAAGIAGAAGISSLLHTTLVFPGSTDVLYGVAFYDPATFLGLGSFLVLVAALASFIPARRAIRVDPMTALRCE